MEQLQKGTICNSILPQYHELSVDTLQCAVQCWNNYCGTTKQERQLREQRKQELNILIKPMKRKLKRRMKRTAKQERDGNENDKKNC